MAVYGYGKIGRTLDLDPKKWGVTGGDAEGPRLLDTLARRHPDDTWVIISQCSDNPQACGYSDNVVNTWTPERRAWFREAAKPYQLRIKEAGENYSAIDDIRGVTECMDILLLPYAQVFDGMVLWAGQHGTSNTVLPAVTNNTGAEGWTRPYDTFINYVGGILRLTNEWRNPDPLAREEIWLIADARNYLKARDIKWPSREEVLGQFNFHRVGHHERYGETRTPKECGFIDPKYPIEWKTDHTWKSVYHYTYSGLEVCSLLPQHIDPEYNDEWEGRGHFGLFINEAGGHSGKGAEQTAKGKFLRKDITRDWVLPIQPAFIHGKWTKPSQRELDIEVAPASFADFYPLLRSVRTTFTTPSSGSGWATTKPWEAFAAGTVCFRHPEYDTQNHIYGQFSDDVREWLSPKTPNDLYARVQLLNTEQGRATWLFIQHAQRQLFLDMVHDMPWVKMIEKRLGV